jgi:hypothetical protein
MTFKLSAAALSLSLALAGAASAATYNEVGDAGATIATAQAVAAGTTTINGSLQSPFDVDLYSFTLASATSIVIDGLGWALSGIDSNLILFDGLGHGIFGDDDSGPATLESRISLTLAAGSYLLAYGDNNIYSYDSLNHYVIGDDDGFVGLTSNTHDHFMAYGGRTGAYQINFSTAVDGPAAVPLPASLPLMLVAVGGMAGLRRARRKTA